MYSWQLWRDLHQYDPAHPVFQRASRTADTTALWVRRFNPLADMRLRLALLVLVLAASLVRPEVILLLLLLPAMLMLVIAALPAWLPLVVFAYGLVQAVAISHTLATEKGRATHDLLYLGSAGPLGTDWTISRAMLHRGEGFALLRVVVRVILLPVCLLIGGLALIPLLALLREGTPALAANSGQALRTLVEAALLVALMVTGYTQSIVMSVLVGMLMPHYVRSREIVAMSAAGVYSALQVGSYALALAISFDLLPVIYRALPVEGWLAGIVLALLRFALVLGSRELLIYMLWQRLLDQLNIDPVEAETARAITGRR